VIHTVIYILADIVYKRGAFFAKLDEFAFT
ncbi:unnamed protein product, partial [marine sediment metagenome]